MTRRSYFLLLLAAALFLVSASPPEEATREAASLDAIFETFFEGFLKLHPTYASSIGDERYKTSPHFTEAEKALMDLTVQIGIDANRVSKDLWDRLHKHFTEPQIVEAVFTITVYIAVSKFGDALGVELEPVFSGIQPILEVAH